ncbi:apolipoprotein D-like [Achroia grisella]|uniref:apolipoprotein D-like n=1 Tax=Achroia grisella TaxID=688607 RepID=UPI0027D2DEC2|nr:apolipoprotein D-like [Achroia grisella]
MWQIFVLALLGSAAAQIPSLGWCPDFQPMANFSMNRFLGTWYEAERYFTVSELASRCVTTNYVSTPEGRILVANEIINYLTGVKRVMEGSLQMIGREGEGRIMVKYSSLPLPYDYEYSILDTDYDSFAVMWSCSGLGPVHTQSAWLLTRDRLAAANIMQRAYAVLDKYKISRAFFVKTSQADCTVLPDPAASPISGKNSGLVNEAAKELDEIEIPASEPVKASEIPQNKLPVKASEPEVKAQQVPEIILSESEKIEAEKEKSAGPVVEVQPKVAEKLKEKEPVKAKQS